MLVDCLALRPVRQTTDASCGPAALLCALRYLGVAGRATERSLMRQVECDPDYGTLETSLLAVASSRWTQCELRCRASTSELVAWLEAGSVPLLVLQAWRAPSDPPYDHPESDAGHWAVAAGVCDAGVVLADSGLGKLARISWSDFESRWHAPIVGRCWAPGIAMLMRHAAGKRRRVPWGSLPWLR